jgi:TonB family protein
MLRKLLTTVALLLFAAPIVLSQTPAPATTSAPMKVGGDVLPPKLISTVEPKYPSPLFHKPKPSLVLVGITVPADGIPTDLHIVKSGGNSFDKSALNAVKQYRFQPATLHGKPVPVAINSEVQFKIF